MGYKRSQKRNSQLRRLYARHFGPIPIGREIHHWIPVFAGGTDDLSNLVALTPHEHMQAHWTRWKELGDFRDLCAYYMIGYNFTEAHRISSSVGGSRGGTTVKLRRNGICTDDLNMRRKWASMGGRVGARSQMRSRTGIHGATPEQNRKWASMGGKIGGFTQSELQRELGRRGGPKNKGFVWLTDGKMVVKYSIRMQAVKSVDEYLLENPQFRRGRPKAGCRRAWVNDGGRNRMVRLLDGQSLYGYLAVNPTMKAGRIGYAENQTH